MGHIAINYPNSKCEFIKGKHKIHHAHATEDDEPDQERTKEEDSREEYVLISSLIGTVTHGSDTWIIDSGSSKHMSGYKDSFSELVQKYSAHKVMLGDDYQYPIKGVRETYYKLDSVKPMKMNDVLYVPNLKKNLLSISALDEKGFKVSFIDGEVLMWPRGKYIDVKGVGEASYKLDYRKAMKKKDVLYVPGLKKNRLSISCLDEKGFIVAFIDGKFFMWPRGKCIDDDVVIGVQEGGLYKLKGYSNSTLVHNTITPSELWHIIFSHIHYKSI
jgi:hypothetical protein